LPNDGNVSLENLNDRYTVNDDLKSLMIKKEKYSERTPNKAKPEILAPAGGKAEFLAAIAAGADAVYCGLKRFSARMAAENFTLDELVRFTRLAHDKGTAVYIAINSLVKSDELDKAGKFLDQLNRWVKPDALIIQDAAMLLLARQTGFSGEIHLSTLANITFPDALNLIKKFPLVSRVVLPRELNIDEIKMMAGRCPKNLSLEVFIHGALCYAVSGRCYWSSYLGGKSGLRGRCVQPCRRMYTQNNIRSRYFACKDLWIDVLTKVITGIPEISGLKIEGRKKGRHYVYYTVTAYKLLRDHGSDPKIKKTALRLLEYALGRQGTHYNFLPQRPQNPIQVASHTGSGLLTGSVKGGKSKPYISPRHELLPKDKLRVGYEDEPWHSICPVKSFVPKRGRLYLKLTGKKVPPKNTPVFLIDRKEPELKEQVSALFTELEKFSHLTSKVSSFKINPSRKKRLKKTPMLEMVVNRNIGQLKSKADKHIGTWLNSGVKRIQIKEKARFWYWLPPVIWPEDEEKLKFYVSMALKKGCKNYVLNAPWQAAFFQEIRGLNLWAGPYCNIANEMAIEKMAEIGFSGVIVSPEIGRSDYSVLPAKSPLPLGIVISGNWPLCISRTIEQSLKPGVTFTSPRGERAWIRKYGQNFWIFPDWKIDIHSKQHQLKKLGFSVFVHVIEPLPRGVKLKKRPGAWNWDIGLT